MEKSLFSWNHHMMSASWTCGLWLQNYIFYFKYNHFFVEKITNGGGKTRRVLKKNNTSPFLVPAFCCNLMVLTFAFETCVWLTESNFSFFSTDGFVWKTLVLLAFCYTVRAEGWRGVSKLKLLEVRHRRKLNPNRSCFGLWPIWVEGR